MNSSRIALVGVGISVASVTIALSAPSIALPGKNKVDGGDIVNNSVTGKDVDESSLGTVPKAAGLAPLPSGKSQSGVFSAAGGNSGAGGWLGVPVNYPRPLKAPIANDNIVDAYHTGDSTHCPGPGKAAAGYLCLYNDVTWGTGRGYGYSEDGFMPTPSIGVVVYFPVTGSQPYVGGTWTVTAP